jgi:transposase InsO family protein
MTVVQPKPFHPWSWQGTHYKREHFDSDASYWRYWARRLQLSLPARLRLEWMIFYHFEAKRNGTKTAKHFGIARQIFVKWKSRFKPDDLTSLEDKSRAPHHKRVWTVTEEEERNIILLRKKHMKWGKDKLQRRYQKVFGVHISTNKIQKVINKHNLFPDPEIRKRKLKRRVKRRNKTYIHTFEKKKELGFLWHTDSIIIWWYGARRVIFTAMEEMTKIGYARVYTTNSSKNAKDFLQRLLYLANNQVKHIHHDNGSEFYGDFEQACKELGVQQIFSRARTPKDNPALERFNWSVQDEWLSMSEYGLDDLPFANQDLTNWLIEYNDVRPHESLDYLTPLEYATKTFEVSPMWSSRTQVLGNVL